MHLDPITGFLARNIHDRGIVVLMYHSITQESCPRWPWEITIESFAAQLDYLQSRSLNVFPVRRLFEQDCPSSGVVITFDDGYANNMDAAKLLQENGLTATWYITSGDIGTTKECGRKGGPVLAMMTADDIRSLADMGMEIGAHGRSHCDLVQQTPDAIDHEVRGSRHDLESILSRPIESFAYPYGRYSKDVLLAVRQAGYQTACTTRSGWYRPEEDMLQIRRITVFGGDSLSVFVRKLVFADNNVGWAKMARYVARRAAGRVGL